jgi:hypothetical protein
MAELTYIFLSLSLGNNEAYDNYHVTLTAWLHLTLSEVLGFGCKSKCFLIQSQSNYLIWNSYENVALSVYEYVFPSLSCYTYKGICGIRTAVFL